MAKKNKWADHYSRRAREEKWLARSVYKLEEIDKKYKLLRHGYCVLDLGCYPGSWSQYCIKKIGKTGEVIGIDQNTPNGFSAPNFKVIEADIFTLNTQKLVCEIGQRDLVISDMAPKTSGISSVDTALSIELAEKALEIAQAILKKRGNFLCKVFEGKDFKDLKERSSEYFTDIRIIRPLAVRKGSREVYLLGLKLV